jgi:hypothetical protein
MNTNRHPSAARCGPRLDVSHKALEEWSEGVRRLSERRMAEAEQAMAPPFP